MSSVSLCFHFFTIYYVTDTHGRLSFLAELIFSRSVENKRAAMLLDAIYSPGMLLSSGKQCFINDGMLLIYLRQTQQ